MTDKVGQKLSNPKIIFASGLKPIGDRSGIAVRRIVENDNGAWVVPIN
jgi:hypothetical protein